MNVPTMKNLTIWCYVPCYVPCYALFRFIIKWVEYQLNKKRQIAGFISICTKIEYFIMKLIGGFIRTRCVIGSIIEKDSTEIAHNGNNKKS